MHGDNHNPMLHHTNWERQRDGQFSNCPIKRGKSLGPLTLPQRDGRYLGSLLIALKTGQQDSLQQVTFVSYCLVLVLILGIKILRLAFLFGQKDRELRVISL